MNTKVLLLGAVITAFAISSFAAEPLLSPRAAGNQIKHLSSSVAATTTTITYSDASSAFLSPRAAGNQIRTVKGFDNDVNAAVACRNSMGGTPKTVAECSSHTTMPGCVSIALAK
jgi:hypothetical protein